MTFNEQYLLWQLAEEAAELVMADDLTAEASDFIAVVQMCQDAGLLDTLPFEVDFHGELIPSLALVVQRASKLAHFGLDEKQVGQNHTNRERLTFAVTKAVKKIQRFAQPELIAAKKLKVAEYLKYAKQLS